MTHRNLLIIIFQKLRFIIDFQFNIMSYNTIVRKMNKSSKILYTNQLCFVRESKGRNFHYFTYGGSEASLVIEHFKLAPSLF